MQDEKVKLDLVNGALAKLSISDLSSLVLDPEDEVVKDVVKTLQDSINQVLTTFIFDWSYNITNLVQYNDGHGGYVTPRDFLTFIGVGDASNCCCGCSGFQNFDFRPHKANARRPKAQHDKTRNFESRLYIETPCCSSICFTHLHYVSNDNNYGELDSYPHLKKLIILQIAKDLSFKYAKNDKNLIKMIYSEFEEEAKKAKTHQVTSYRNDETCILPPFSVGQNRIF